VREEFVHGPLISCTAVEWLPFRHLCPSGECSKGHTGHIAGWQDCGIIDSKDQTPNYVGAIRCA
jgi:hypothetical protein